MENPAALIFPHQLFSPHPCLEGGVSEVILWGGTCDGLYWHIIAEHRKAFQKNLRMKVMVAMLDRMKTEVREKHLRGAEAFLPRMEGAGSIPFSDPGPGERHRSGP